MLNEEKPRKAGKRQRNIKLFEPKLIKESFTESFIKLNPKVMMKNPVMFTVEIGTAVMVVITLVSLSSGSGQSAFGGSFIYNLIITISTFSYSPLRELCRSDC